MKKKSTPEREPSGAPEAGLSRAALHGLYYYMKLCRTAEERLSILHRRAKLVGTLYRSLGQEATAVGAAFALEKDDVLCPMIRDTAALYVRGHSPRELFANYLGRATSPTGGKDGNQHFGDKAKGTIGTVSMMGSVIPVVMGAAWARRRLGMNSVGLTFVGDGGTSTGDFHEALNFASVRKFPLVLIAESNGWAYSVPTSLQMNVRDIAVRASAYNIPGMIVDGNDVLEVYSATKRACEHARAGKGPVLIEAKTYRMKGHAEHDDARYVSAEVLAEWRKRDPIDRYAKYLKDRGLLTGEEEEALIARVNRDIDDAERFALESPMPQPESALAGVFEDDSIVKFVPWWER